MVSHDETAVLIDFGVSEEATDETLTNVGSYLFFAPELFNRKDSNVKINGEKTDIWSLGVTLYFMLTGTYPTKDAKDLIDLKERITKGEVDYSLIKNENA